VNVEVSEAVEADLWSCHTPVVVVVVVVVAVVRKDEVCVAPLAVGVEAQLLQVRGQTGQHHHVDGFLYAARLCWVEAKKVRQGGRVRYSGKSRKSLLTA
jgi:hypothetical protein